MRRVGVMVLAGVMIMGACGGGSGSEPTSAATTTTAAATTTTPATTTTAAATGTWFDGLDTGVCFDDALDDTGQYDFSVPAVIVSCDTPHDNEIVARVPLGEGEFPAATVAADAAAVCADAYDAFLSHPIDETLLFGFTVWPDENDWDAGARAAICAVYSGGRMIGTAASGDLAAPGEALAVVVIADESQQLWIIDGGTGELRSDLTAAGSPEPTGPATWAPDASTVAIGAPGIAGDADIFLIDPLTGETLVLVETSGADEGPAIAPQGTVIAYASNVAGEEFDIFVFDVDAATTTQVTLDADREASPTWSPDGTQIAFRGRVVGNSDIYVVELESGLVTRLTDDPGFDGDPRWSPDGSQILFSRDRAGAFDIWVMNADGSGQSRLTAHPADDEYPSWSSDGALIAFQSNRLGFYQVWVMRADGSDQSLLVGSVPSAYPAFGPPGALAALD